MNYGISVKSDLFECIDLEVLGVDYGRDLGSLTRVSNPKLKRTIEPFAGGLPGLLGVCWSGDVIFEYQRISHGVINVKLELRESLTRVSNPKLKRTIEPFFVA